MATEWIDGEAGPRCSCGGPTIVKQIEGEGPVALCLEHSGEASAFRRLLPTKTVGPDPETVCESLEDFRAGRLPPVQNILAELEAVKCDEPDAE